MKYTFIFTILCIVLLVNTKCEKDEVQKREYPVLTTEIGKIDESGVFLKGEVLVEAEIEPETIGFAFWREGAKVSHTIRLKKYSKHFSYKLNTDITKGTKYEIRSFAESEEYLSYGSEESFVSKGFKRDKPVIIHNYSPVQVTDGVRVGISGENFSFLRDKINLSVEGKDAFLLYANKDSLLFSFPSLSLGEKNAVLKVYDEEVEFGPFEVKNPLITDFNPKEGHHFTKVVIKGKFFGEYPWVYFNDERVSYIIVNDSSLIVYPPKGAEVGDNEITVDVSGKTATAHEKFSLKFKERPDTIINPVSKR